MLITGLCITNLCVAQDNTGCFTEFQLMRMQKTSLNDLSNFLNEDGWNFDGAKSNKSFNYFDYSINYNIVQWEKSSYNSGGNLMFYYSPGKPNIIIYQATSTCFQQLLNIFSSNSKGFTKVKENILMTAFKEGDITIEFREYKNDYTSRQYSVLIYNGASLQQAIEVERNRQEAEIKAERDRQEAERQAQIDCQNAVKEADRLYNLNRYEEAKSQYEFADQFNCDNDITNKINSCNNFICDKLISDAAAQFDLGNYEFAKKLYEKAIPVAKKTNNTYKLTQLESQISVVTNKIKEIKVMQVLEIADAYFVLNNFELALVSYNEVLILDLQNKYAIEGIETVNFLKDLLSKRKTSIFSYQQINPTDFSSFKDELQTSLDNKTKTDKNGVINFEFKIAFDTLGFNKSTLTLNRLSDTKYSGFLNQISKSNTLLPSKISHYFVASQESINVDLKWQKDIIKITSKSKGINATLQDLKINGMEYRKYINNYPSGKWTFDVTNKTINNSTFNDIRLVKYKTSAGPASAFYSMLLPGMGTLKVTKGEKGRGRTAWFLISSGLAIGSKLHSNKQYENYLSATDQVSIDNYYDKANTSNKIALISGGLSLSIYLHDIIWVFSKGAKNQKETKSLREKLNQAPIEIQNQPISLK